MRTLRHVSPGGIHLKLKPHCKRGAAGHGHCARNCGESDRRSMVQAILSDICIEAQVRVLVAILTGPDWQELWSSLNLRYCTFRDLGLAPDTSDADIWDRCQREQMVLITANRNADGPD